MVIVTLQQVIDERISFLKEQINPNNKPQVNSTFQIQIDAMRSAATMFEKDSTGRPITDFEEGSTK
jgi:hypothetical protein